MRRFRQPLLILVAAIAIATSGGAISLSLPSRHADAHQQYSSITCPSNTTCYFPNFYLPSGGLTHYVEQTYPDNKLCLHTIRVYATGQLLIQIWLKGNNDPNHPNNVDYFGVGASVSTKVTHAVYCSGTIQVYYWHA